jgi:hypothetical protein
MCDHKDGWILKTEIVISDGKSEFGNDDFHAEFVCNHLGCNEKKTFKFDITNVEEVKK